MIPAAYSIDAQVIDLGTHSYFSFIDDYRHVLLLLLIGEIYGFCKVVDHSGVVCRRDREVLEDEMLLIY